MAVKNLTFAFGGPGLALAAVISLAYGCSANHVIGAADGGGSGSAGTPSGGAGGGTGGGGVTAGAGGTSGLAGQGKEGGLAGSGDGAGAAGTGAAGTGAAVTGAAGTGAAGAAGTGGTAGASGTACGFPMPNPASTGLPNPASYTDNHDGTVTDNVTGLTWEGTVDQSSATSGDPGPYTQAAAAAYCANKVPVGSWRSPTRLELASLVDFTVGTPGPMINETYFPNTPVWRFWTSSAYVPAAGSAWLVNFGSGPTYSVQGAVTNAYWVRCVSGAPKCYATRYQIQGGGLVLDAATGLTWQQRLDAGLYTWAAANTYCAGLGAGWRMPSITELQSIVDDTKAAPAIDGTVFPNTPGVQDSAGANNFWTSSVVGSYAWQVSFSAGNTGTNTLTLMSRARCVR
jgi:hypothetical protein